MNQRGRHRLRSLGVLAALGVSVFWLGCGGSEQPKAIAPGENPVGKAMEDSTKAAGIGKRAPRIEGSAELLDAKDAEGVTKALKGGAKINGQNERGDTALTLAAGRGVFPVVEALVSKGADVNIASNDGITALMRVIGYFPTGMGGGNTGQGAPNLSEIKAKTVTSLLAKTTDVNVQSQKGSPPFITSGASALIVAARSGELPSLKLLLEKGAKVDLQDQGGKTALMHAAAGGKPEMAEALLTKGANVALKDGEGKTALEFAQQRKGDNYRRCEEILKKAEANRGM